MKMQHDNQMAGHNGKMYYRLVAMTLLSFISMYILMYAMVDEPANVFPNVNQFYMAGLMAMPMLLIELILMRMMYKNKRLNAIFLVAALVLGVGFFLAIRQQASVQDRQFLRSMIPHHAAAVLMVEEAELSDPEIKQLAEEIIQAQQREIAQMKAKLEEIQNKR